MDFDERLEKYAELIVKTGVNVQKGQPVILYISVDQAKLARLIVAKHTKRVPAVYLSNGATILSAENLSKMLQTNS